MITYTVILPTKSGGTVLYKYLQKHYREHFKSHYHMVKCANDNNSIIIVRDVKERFISMYKYWKNGSELFKRDIIWKDRHKHITILDFIQMIKQNDRALTYDFTWGQHFSNTCEWIPPTTDYKNIIILKYEKKLEDKIKLLLRKLNIPDKNIPVPIINKSLPIENEDDILNNTEVDEFIREYFSRDIDLINAINTKPELFKMVV
jgi:hypothetical protein